MSMKRGGRTDLSLEKSRILGAYETSWRHWRAFIAEQKDQLQRQHGDAGTFADPLGIPLSTSSAPVKAALPGDVRQELMRVLELRRQESQARAEDARQQGDPAPDRDTVFATVLDHIDRELAGTVHPSGRALVWHEGRLHEFNHRRVLAHTTAADYANTLGDTSAQRRRTLMGVGIGVVALVLVGVLLVVLNLGEDTTTATTVVRAAQVAGEAVPLWDVTDIGIAGHTYPVSFARTGYPLLVCAPDASQHAITPEATLTLTGTASVRSYDLTTASATSYDLLVADCDQRPPAPLATGQLRRAATSSVLDPALLTSVAVIGSDMDPQAIPPDRMQVTLSLDTAAGMDGTLLLADGSRVAPSRTSSATTTVTFQYLVPLANAAQPAGWEYTRPGALPAVLAFTLPPPQRRADLLRNALAVTAPQAVLRQDATGIGVQLTLTLTNRSDQSLALRATDLTLSYGTTAGAACDWNPPLLNPHQTVTHTAVCMSTVQETPREVTLAGWRVQLSAQP